MVNNGPLPMRPSPWLLDNWQLTPGNSFSKNASAEDTTARASHPNLSLACFSHHIGPAMWKPATWEADTGLARPGLVTDAGGQGSRLGFPSRKASLGIPLPRREAEPRKNIWRILFFSCAAAGPTAGHESAGTPPRRGSPRPAKPTPSVL